MICFMLLGNIIPGLQNLDLSLGISPCANVSNGSGHNSPADPQFQHGLFQLGDERKAGVIDIFPCVSNWVFIFINDRSKIYDCVN